MTESCMEIVLSISIIKYVFPGVKATSTSPLSRLDAEYTEIQSNAFSRAGHPSCSNTVTSMSKPLITS